MLDIVLGRIFKLLQSILARRAKRLIIIDELTGMRQHLLRVADGGLVVLRHDKVLDGLVL